MAKKNKKGGRIKTTLKTISFSFLFFVAVFLLLFLYYAQDFPRPEVFTERQLAQSTKIYDRTGEVLLYEIYGEEKRSWVPLNSIPEHLQQAVVATEDSYFYEHIGIDVKGIIRSVLINIQTGKLGVGGSTIPQQLIRSTFLTPDKTIERKFKEIILAIELDRRYSKDQILEWYLNQVPFGQNAYGAEAASLTYFNKSVSEVSVAESAILASLIQAPSRYSPYGENKDLLLERKNYILDRMQEENFISEETAQQSKEEEIIFIKNTQNFKAPYFTLWIKQQLEEKYSQEFLMKKGLKVYTSLDWEIQQIAEEETKKGVEYNKALNAYNAGLVAIDPQTGEVLAMTVGTGDYYADSFPEGCISGKTCLFDPKFNIVIGLRNKPGRQPGSAFKPFVYAAAFNKGFDDKTTVIDEETNFGIWGGEEYIPQNYDGLYRGEVTLREALAQSLNIPSIKTLLNLAGLEESVQLAEDLGINTLYPAYGPSIVLGGWETKLLEMTSAYGVFANDGLKISPVSILKIEDLEGNIIEENQKTPKRVLETSTARLINNILSDNEARAPMFGLYSMLHLPGHQIAAKTGTTQDYRDAWTIGYTPSIVTGVWVGNNNNESMSEKPSVVLAGPIFHNFMERVLKIIPQKSFIEPDFN